MVTVSAATTKDTCRNVLETKEFVVNIVSEPFVQAMNSTSIDGPPELDEWEVSGLASLPSVSWSLYARGLLYWLITLNIVGDG
jgi:flavin reductase (DIM6/NTAB) family NADH-FMN oxidoreductase RutF